MRRVALLSVLALVAMGPGLEAGAVLRTLEWQNAPDATDKVTCALEKGDVGRVGVLAVTNVSGDAVTFPAMTVDSPGITSAQFAIRGRIKYAGMAAGSYLEMLAIFGDGDAIFFSRTLGRRGLMAALNGDSDWRTFLLPFRIVGRDERPEKLVVSVTFTGPGAIWIGPLELVEYDESEDMLRLPGQWWGPQTGGLVGAFLGTLFGVCGAVIGFFSRSGRGRRIVLVISTNVIVVGTAALILTAIAFFSQQPYVVWFPLLLTGILGAGLPLVAWFPCRRRFAEVEFRMDSSRT